MIFNESLSWRNYLGVTNSFWNAPRFWHVRKKFSNALSGKHLLFESYTNTALWRSLYQRNLEQVLQNAPLLTCKRFVFAVIIKLCCMRCIYIKKYKSTHAYERWPFCKFHSEKLHNLISLIMLSLKWHFQIFWTVCVTLVI